MVELKTGHAAAWVPDTSTRLYELEAGIEELHSRIDSLETKLVMALEQVHESLRLLVNEVV